MKEFFMLPKTTTAAMLLVVLVGCDSSSTPTMPPTIGDFVKNRNGVGTAQVFGIDFRVKVDLSGASTEDAIAASFIDPEQSGARKRFTLGDDITIQLDSRNALEVGFIFNDQDFGGLKVGDQVVIDEERNVEVNGTPRMPSASR